MKKITILFSMILFTSIAYAQDSSAIRIIDPEVYELQIQNDEVQLVDVRTPQEFGEGYIDGAENIDFLAEGFLPKFEKFDREKPIYIYCRSGNRSSKAAAKLSEMGFSKIIDLKGGYEAWAAEKLN